MPNNAIKVARVPKTTCKMLSCFIWGVAAGTWYAKAGGVVKNAAICLAMFSGLLHCNTSFWLVDVT